MVDVLPSQEHCLGCLLGGALGDALGYPIEFLSSAEITLKFGAETPRKLAYTSQALISDDTQMTLFSAEALVRARGGNVPAITRFALGAYQRWYTTQEMSPSGAARVRRGHGLLLAEPRLHARRAPGNTCLSALALSYTRNTPASAADPPNGSKGCGAVMRAAPFGLAAMTRVEAFSMGRNTAVLTHGHPSGYLSAAYLAALVYDLSRGAPLECAMSHADSLLAREPENDELAAALAGARALAASGPPSVSAIEQLGGGWVGEEALAIALACALTAKPECVSDALWRAVDHGGDSDSTGSITGNILGAMYGAKVFPAEWREELELVDLIERVAVDLHAVATQSGSPDPSDYPPVDGALLLSQSPSGKLPHA